MTIRFFRKRLPLALGLLFCAMVPAHAQTTAESEPEDSSEETVIPDRWSRDQATLRSIVCWNGKIIAFGEDFFEIDVRSLAAGPLKIPGLSKLSELAARGTGEGLAIGIEEGKSKLVSCRRATVQAVNIPEEVRAHKRAPRLCADGKSIVLLSRNWCHRFDGSNWTRIRITRLDDPSLAPYEGARSVDVGEANHLLLVGETVYLGYDSGEWGGSLLALDIRSGKLRRVSDRWRDGGRVHWMPVTAVKRSTDGTIWAAEGLAHLSLLEGSVYRVDSDAWKQVVHIDNLGVAGSSKGAHAVDWPLPPSDINGLEFDSSGRLHLLAGCLGVLRKDKAGWTRLTPDWPDYVYVEGMVLADDGRPVIATYDAGVLVCTPEKKRIDRIMLAKPSVIKD